MGKLTAMLGGRDPDEVFAYYTTKKHVFPGIAYFMILHSFILLIIA